MSAKKTDISQIRKYLNGELDARAMHQLEREAQDDPFLMDALEGYAAAAENQQPQLDDLDNRLQQRIGQSKVRRIIPWKYYAAAASILIVFTLGYLLWPVNKPVLQESNITAKLKTPAPAQQSMPPPADHLLAKADTGQKAPAKATLIAANTPPPAARSMVSQSRLKAAAPTPASVTAANAAIRIDEPVGNSDNKVVAEKADTVQYAAAPYSQASKRDSTVLKEVTIMRYGAVQKKSISIGNASSFTPQSLQGKLDGVQVTTPDRVSGTVMDQMGIPIPGASVIIKGTQNGTQTDALGHFSLAAKDKETLAINSIGYNRAEVTALANNNLKITLNENKASLNEVVVVGYGQAVKTDKNAHPKTGWDNYNQYLKRGAIATDGKTGNVRISFTVNSDGALADFKIISGLNNTSNKQAISLVQNGPAWVPDASGKAKTVKLKIHFNKE